MKKSKAIISENTCYNLIDAAVNFTDSGALDAFGNIMPGVKLASSVIKFTENRKLKAFFSGFASHENPTEETLKELLKLANSEKKANLLLDIISKLMNACCTEALYLLGIILKASIAKEDDLTHQEFICANTLLDFHDFDLQNIMIINKFLNRGKKTTNKFAMGSEFKTWCSDNGTPYTSSMELTIEKCVSKQILLKDIDVDVENEVDIDESDVTSASVNASTYTYIDYRFSEPGDLLLSNLKFLNKNEC